MSFSLDLSKFSNLTEKKMETVVKKVSIGLTSDIIKDVPVLSGRARSSFFLDINKFSDKETNTTDKSGDKTIANAVSKANEYKLCDTVTIVSNLPYIERLEYGYSKKSPNGFMRLNIIRWSKIVDKEAKKIK
ncbi:MAG: HK97 gp10 family phage protein [Campylobacterota bacterium]|nr:HK97 gp10 family phage protein [Campylobacterota bacterium]